MRLPSASGIYTRESVARGAAYLVFALSAVVLGCVWALLFLGCAAPAPASELASATPSASVTKSPASLDVAGAQLSDVSAAAFILCDGHCGTVLVHPDPDVDGAQAAIAGAYAEIKYDPADLGEGLAGAVAHEWGHLMHVAIQGGHLEGGHAAELAADTWAGCILQLADVPVEPFLRFLLTSAAQFETDTHPGGARRVEAVETGQRLCTTGSP